MCRAKILIITPIPNIHSNLSKSSNTWCSPVRTPALLPSSVLQRCNNPSVLPDTTNWESGVKLASIGRPWNIKARLCKSNQDCFDWTFIQRFLPCCFGNQLEWTLASLHMHLSPWKRCGLCRSVSKLWKALFPKLIGTSKLRIRDPTFYEIGTQKGPSAAKIGTQNNDLWNRTP